MRGHMRGYVSMTGYMLVCPTRSAKKGAMEAGLDPSSNACSISMTVTRVAVSVPNAT